MKEQQAGFAASLECFGDFIGGAKDYVIRLGLNGYINYIKGIGKVLDLKIDPDTKSISLTVELKGESEPISLKALKYELLERDGKNYIKIGEFEASKEWMNVVLNSFVKGKEFEIDSKAAKTLELFI